MKRVKIVTFVPIENTDEVLNAIGDAGAGLLGNYSHCSWTVNGEGHFLPLEGATPHIGKVGEKEDVKETRIEVLVDYDKAKDVVKALRESHPYEEVAFDIIPLLDEDEL